MHSIMKNFNRHSQLLYFLLSAHMPPASLVGLHRYLHIKNLKYVEADYIHVKQPCIKDTLL